MQKSHISFAEKRRERFKDIITVQVVNILSELRLEQALTQRLIYKHSNAHRGKIYFVRFARVGQLARILVSRDMECIFVTIAEAVDGQNSDTLNNLHANFFKDTKFLTVRLKNYTEAAARCISSSLLSRQFFVPMSLCFLAVLSRCRALAIRLSHVLSELQGILASMPQHSAPERCIRVQPNALSKANFSRLFNEDVGEEIVTEQSGDLEVASRCADAGLADKRRTSPSTTSAGRASGDDDDTASLPEHGVEKGAQPLFRKSEALCLLCPCFDV